MKKISLAELKLTSANLLSREQMKNVIGGSTPAKNCSSTCLNGQGGPYGSEATYSPCTPDSQCVYSPQPGNIYCYVCIAVPSGDPGGGQYPIGL